MALYDNKFWLLSHIRNSFISTDGTGMCELVMTGESKDIKKYISHLETFRDPEESEEEDDDFASCDYQSDVEFGIRDLTNSSSHIEKLDYNRKKSSKITHIKWDNSNLQSNTSGADDMFVKKEVRKRDDINKRVSRLTKLIQNSAHLPKNPFVEYARFDGSGQVNISIKRYRIYLTMLPPEQRNYPLTVSCIASAKVQDLIGLILLKYSLTYDATNLLSVNQYGLYITEEDGEVDRDFPCLDPKEPISKFGFTCLGLVEHKDVKNVSFPEETINVHFNTLEQTRTRTISDKAKAEETRQMENDIQAIERHNKLMEAPLYRAFRVFMVTKVKRKIEVSMGVSGDRIEIDPLPQKTSKLIPFKQKAVSFPIESIVYCDITDVKSNKASFRLEYHISDPAAPSDKAGTSTGTNTISSPLLSALKHYDFECDNATAQDIVNKIKLLIEMKFNSSGIGHKSSKERKPKKRFNPMKNYDS